MLKKEIISKIKSIPEHITNIDDIVNYIFKNEVKVEKLTYMAFRSAKLKEMVDNSISYKEKIAIISIEWKKVK
jgi:hypothetical protein